jgi:hypothetical protein
MLVGDLVGVDLLLGLDWLISMGAIIDFYSMTAEIGPRQRVQLRSTSRKEPSTGVSYVKVLDTQDLIAGHTTKVYCTLEGEWETLTPGIFESHVKIGDGIYFPHALVQPDPSTGVFVLGVANHTTQNWNLVRGTVLGQLDPVMPSRKEHDETILSSPSTLCSAVNEPPVHVTTGDLGTTSPRVEERGLNFTVNGGEETDEYGLPWWRAPPLTDGNWCMYEPSSGTGKEASAARVKYSSAASGDVTGLDLVGGVHDTDATRILRCNCQGQVIPGEVETPGEVEFPDGKPSKWSFDLLAGNTCTDRVSIGDTLVGDGPGTQPGLDPASATLPAHLRCVMPPEGVLNKRQTLLAMNLVLDFQDIFVGPDGKVGFTNKVTHRVDTGSQEPVKLGMRRKSFREKEYISEEVHKMLEAGQITPSKSPWGAAVVLVRKKDGTLRFCVDYRKLNDVTKKDAYPLPRIEECLDALNGARFFSLMDLASGYWQVQMDPKDREKTAFLTHIGLFEWLVMPFGLCNAPATFCRLMELVLADIVWSRCLVYLDDIVAFGTTFEEAYDNLKAVFTRLRKANLKLKPKKCQFFLESV